MYSQVSLSLYNIGLLGEKRKDKHIFVPFRLLFSSVVSSNVPIKRFRTMAVAELDCWADFQASLLQNTPEFFTTST